MRARSAPAWGFTAVAGRLLGADPAVFVPFVHAYGLMVRRRSRFQYSAGRSRAAGRGLSPFHFMCIMAVVVGWVVMDGVSRVRPPLLGTIIALTFGALLVLYVVLFDYIDVMSNSDEYRVMAAHPHDAWSIVSAKIFVVGRAIATIAVLYFTPGILKIGFQTGSVLAAAAFATGAALGTATAALAGLLLGVGVLSRWGRVALLRFLPVVQSIFFVFYFGIVFGQPWLGKLTSSAEGLSPWIAFLPIAWFAAPLEWATGAATPESWLRGALAFGSVAGLVGIGARWRRSGFGEGLLAMGRSANPPAVRRESRTRAGAPWIRDPAARVFFSVARIHARTDLAFRSQLVVAFMVPAMVVLSSSLSIDPGRRSFPELVLMFVMMAVGIATMSLTVASTASSRPDALWPVLCSPVSRERYSLALRGALRWGLVLPVTAVLGAWYLTAASGVPWPERIARVAGVAVYFDFLVTLYRGISSDPPFSVRPNRDWRLQWSQVAGMLIGFAIAGGGGFGLFLLWMIRGWGSWLALAVVLVWRVPIEFWTRWRVRRAWRVLETG